jgi:hypothetical protein
MEQFRAKCQYFNEFLCGAFCVSLGLLFLFSHVFWFFHVMECFYRKSPILLLETGLILSSLMEAEARVALCGNSRLVPKFYFVGGVKEMCAVRAQEAECG